MCTDLPFSVPLSPVSLAVPCGAAPSSHQLCRWRGSRVLPVCHTQDCPSLSLCLWPLSPRASPYSHPQSHVMTPRMTHLGRGHIPYSAPPHIYYIECATWHTRRRFGGKFEDSLGSRRTHSPIGIHLSSFGQCRWARILMLTYVKLYIYISVTFLGSN